MAKRKRAARAVRSSRPVMLQADVPNCAPGVCDPRRTQGLKAPAPPGTYVLVTLEGPGVFLACFIHERAPT
jgi:hypothetical protein